MPPDPPTLFTLTPTQWPYQSEIAGAGPAMLWKMRTRNRNTSWKGLMCDVDGKNENFQNGQHF